jgi:hypothetical protein
MAENKSNPIMGKLAFAGVFLVVVAAMVGGENSPGFLTMAQKQGEQRLDEERAEKIAKEAPKKSSPKQAKQASSAWYAETSSSSAQTAPKPKEQPVMTIDSDNDTVVPGVGTVPADLSRAAQSSTSSSQARPDPSYDSEEWTPIR